MTDTTKAAAQAKSSPALVLTPNTTSRPTHAGFSTASRIPRVSWAEPRWSPMAVLSNVMAATVATDPMTKNVAVAGSCPTIRRLLPSSDDSARATTDRTRTTKQAMANPVVKMTCRVAAPSS